MKASGRTDSNMDKALISLRMAMCSLARILMASLMARESTSGSMAAFILATLKMDSSMGKEGGKKVKVNRFLCMKVTMSMINKEGTGVFRWASGNIYDGEFKDDERHGKGIMTWTDGSQYNGDWFRGIQHGYGTITFPDGSQKEGYFDNNIYIGKMKEDDGNFTPLDPVKIYPNSSKLTKSNSIKKINTDNIQPNIKNHIESMMINRNRPKPLIKSKYTTQITNSSMPKESGSLPKLKSPLMSSSSKTNPNFYSANKSQKKWFTKRGSSQKKSIVKDNIFDIIYK